MLTTATDFKITKVTASRIHEFDPENIVFGTLFTDHMLIADYVDEEWKNPEILPYGTMTFNPALATLHYGQSIFEGMKAFRNVNDEVVLFRPHENFNRFNVSAARMCMPTLPEEIFIGGLYELLKLDKNWVPDGDDNSLYLRPFMFSTDVYLGVRASLSYRFMIIMSPAGKYYTAPPKVKIETEYIRAAEGGVGYTKCAGNYAASLYPTKLAQQQGYTQLLWTDAKTHTRFEESGTMNAIFVQNGKLITPKTSTTILKGITRDSLVQIARDLGYEVAEQDVFVKDIVDGIIDGTVTEVFGVGTAVVVSPFSAVGFEGTDYVLPKITENSVSSILKKALDNITRGRTTDKFGWVYKI